MNLNKANLWQITNKIMWYFKDEKYYTNVFTNTDSAKVKISLYSINIGPVVGIPI